tara:strand:+ start:21104 stop:22246 length:1143 start_codon:yes stop_codon:yes gene_type:complete
VHLTVHDAISDIDRDAWNALGGRRYPFLRHEFLQAAEDTRCVSPETGWIPRHLTLSDNRGLRAALLLYEKSHSWGEFVFDWAWANAYEQAGLNYYPKLVSAVPFTPATSTRLLLRDANDREAAQATLDAAIALAKDGDYSSLHILFPTHAEIDLLEANEFMLRKDCQFHWHNRQYRSFDDFLATFTSVKRKKARRDRRRVAENGITFRRVRGSDVDDTSLNVIYELISNTFLRRGSLPYFNKEFFASISQQLPDEVLYILAEKDAQIVACAVFFESGTHLYGRYWGSDGHVDSLHFETCYYQGIDYCIETGKSVFEPGTQGEHKVSRGFSPVSTASAHWLAHTEFARAIERYLDDEGRHVDRYIDAIDAHTPYRNAEADE